MTGFLLDTDIISSVPPIARRPVAVAAWLQDRRDSLWLSTISIAEITSGIAKLRREGALGKSGELGAWLDRLMATYEDRILPLDLAAGRLTGTLLDRARAGGHEPGFADLAIGGIAQVHGLVVATRNVRHFRPLGIDIVNPFERDHDP